MVCLHILQWVQLDVDSELFLKNQNNLMIVKCKNYKSEITTTLGETFYMEWISIIKQSFNKTLTELKLNLSDIFNRVDQDIIPEIVVEILSEYRTMFEVYESIKQPIPIRIGDEIFFNGRMVKAKQNCLLVDVGGINNQLVSFNLETHHFENSKISYPELMDLGLQSAETIIASIKL